MNARASTANSAAVVMAARAPWAITTETVDTT